MNGDRKWIANVNAFLSDHNPSQLIIFLTGPVGSGKSTAMKVAQQFCYDFCLAVGVMWSDHTFLFTAYTGAAASLFGEVTISKATFFNQQKALSLNNKNNGLLRKVGPLVRVGDA